MTKEKQVLTTNILEIFHPYFVFNKYDISFSFTFGFFAGDQGTPNPTHEHQTKYRNIFFFAGDQGKPNDNHQDNRNRRARSYNFFAGDQGNPSTKHQDDRKGSARQYKNVVFIFCCLQVTKENQAPTTKTY